MPLNFQTIQGVEVAVLDLKEVPKLPITWNTEEEKPYAQALHEAIFKKMITEPGKYGIHIKEGRKATGPLAGVLNQLFPPPFEYDVYVINE